MRYLELCQRRDAVVESPSSQFISILPDVVQANDVWVLEELHDRYLTLQSVRNRLVARRSRSRTPFGTLYEVGEALSAGVLCYRACDDLDGTVLMPSLVPNHSDSRAAAFANRLAELPVTNISLASPTGSIGGSSRYGGVALGVTSMLAGNLGDAFVFR